MNIVDKIIETLNTKYNGCLDCEEQKADLFVYVKGNEESIKKITTTTIYFNNSKLDVSLYDADIHSLAYINEVI